MIVYLPSNAFGVSKIHNGRYINREFPIGCSVSRALRKAKEWEASDKGLPKRARVGRPKPRGAVGKPHMDLDSRSGNEIYVVPYRDGRGVYRKIRTKLPSIGAEEAMREAYRRAHVMAGRVSDYSPSAPLL